MSELAKRCLAVTAAAACGLLITTTAPAVAQQRGELPLDRGRLDTAPAGYTQYRRAWIYIEPEGEYRDVDHYRAPAQRPPHMRTYATPPYVYRQENIRDPAGGTYVQRTPAYLSGSGYYYVDHLYVDNIRDPAGGTYLQKPYVYYPGRMWNPTDGSYR